MRKALLTAWAVLAIEASWGIAQVRLGAPTSIEPASGPAALGESCVLPASACTSSACCDCAAATRSWVQLDYLMWWLRDASPGFPLVTTGDPITDAPLAGALGSASTRVVRNGSDLDHNMFNGIRLTAGRWLDNGWGIEAGAVLLERRRESFGVSSDAAGNPLLTIPAFLTDFGAAGEERRFFISDVTAPFTGSAVFSTGTRFWGTELNCLRNLSSSPTLDVDGLVGFRFFSLADDFELDVTTTEPNVLALVQDRFETRNHFYGGQVGARIEYRSRNWALGVTGKVALGSTHHVSEVSGSTVLSGAGVQGRLGVNPGKYPGGVFSQTSNIGSQDHDTFTVAPQVQVSFSWYITSRLRAMVGYDFLYSNQMLRAGEQVSRVINSNQSPLSVNYGQPGGAAAPSPLFHRDDFWAQGISIGLETRY